MVDLMRRSVMLLQHHSSSHRGGGAYTASILITTSHPLLYLFMFGVLTSPRTAADGSPPTGGDEELLHRG